jgi:hypothetical protein
LAGLQLDIESFMRYRKISAGFGLITAFIPLVLGAGVAMALGIDFTAALLIGSFWASFMFSMWIAQAAATLAATIIGLETGLYGDDVVNAVMVVVAVSLILTSIGTSRFTPQIPPREKTTVGWAKPCSFLPTSTPTRSETSSDLPAG